MKKTTLSIAALFLISFFLFSSCSDDSPKEFTYVIKGDISVKNNCPRLEFNLNGAIRDSVERDVSITIDLFKDTSEIGEQTKKITLNDSLTGNYSFTFISKTKLDSNWTYTIPKVDIKCPFITCTPQDTVENCFLRSTKTLQRITPVKKDTTVLDLPFECYCG